MAFDAYRDFEISFESAPDGGDGFIARVRRSGTESDATDATVRFDVPISIGDLAKLEDRMTRSTQRRAPPATGSALVSDRNLAQELGNVLFASVFRDDVLRSFEDSLASAQRRNAGLRVRLQFGAAPGLIKFPWEFMYREDTHDFLAMSPDIAIVRDVGVSHDAALPALEGPLEILVVAADPSQDEELQIRREVDALRESVAELERRGEAKLTLLEPSERESTWDALRHELSRKQQADRKPYHFVHFIGHGAFDERAGVGVLLFENDRRREQRFTGDDLATLLRGRGVRFVVINSCSGAVTSESDAFSGVAQSLLRKGIPAVVAMQFEITDRAAIKFATAFYQGIADRLPADEAMTQARLAILGFGNRLEWATPVLYMRPTVETHAPDDRVRREEKRLADRRRAEEDAKRVEDERNRTPDPLPVPVPWYMTGAGRLGGGIAVAALVATVVGVTATRPPTPSTSASPGPTTEATSEATVEATSAPTAPSSVALVPRPRLSGSMHDLLWALSGTATGTAGECPMPHATVTDDFESANVAWSRSPQTVVAHGMMNITPANRHASDTWRNAAFGDGTVCTTILNGASSVTATAAGSAAGIAFWWEKNDYDVFFISSNGTYHVSHFANGRYTRIVQATSSTSIRRRLLESNVLAVRMRGKDATLSINGTSVATVSRTSNFSRYYSGLVAETDEPKPVTWQFEYYGIGP